MMSRSGEDSRESRCWGTTSLGLASILLPLIMGQSQSTNLVTLLSVSRPQDTDRFGSRRNGRSGVLCLF